MTRSRVLSTAMLLTATALLGLAAASPCNPGCGTVTAEPIGSSSTAQGESSLINPTWEHCLRAWAPDELHCATFEGPAYAGVVTGPSAGCAQGHLKLNGDVIASSKKVC